jgi:arylsulfatase A-like enzyme
MRLDNLKLVHTYEQNENELYDLSKDPSEAHNLVPEQMGNATEMWRKLDESLDTMQARRPVLKAAQRKEQ